MHCTPVKCGLSGHWFRTRLLVVGVDACSTRNDAVLRVPKVERKGELIVDVMDNHFDRYDVLHSSVIDIFNPRLPVCTTDTTDTHTRTHEQGLATPAPIQISLKRTGIAILQFYKRTRFSNLRCSSRHCSNVYPFVVGDIEIFYKKSYEKCLPVFTVWI